MASIIEITNPLTGAVEKVDKLDHTAQEIDDGINAAGIESTAQPGCYYRMVGSVVEWFNPPMNPDVEYRTTERYHGKTVYKKLVSLGKVVAGNNTISGFVTALGAIYFKSISVHLGTVATPLFSENSLSGYFSAYITTISNDLNFYVGGGFADYDAYAFAEYTKEVV